MYLQRGQSDLAYPLYRQIIQQNPDRADAWRGLLTALHSTGHDQEALAQIQQMPPAVRRDLENDPAYLQAVGGIYASLGQPQESMLFYNRVRQHYVAQHLTPPADIDIQDAWLLYNSHNDAALVPALLAFGPRTDLTDQQRRTVQTIWANFSVRRANQAADAGNLRLSLGILNAAAATFPDNPDVAKALAGGYARAGLSREAVRIFKAQNLSVGSAGDYKAAIGAALQANDLTDAETWLRFGLDQYPHDPQMLRLAAQFEKARGDNSRAVAYYRESLKSMPAEDPGVALADELSRVPATAPVRTRPAAVANQPQDLVTLLSTPIATRSSAGPGPDTVVPTRPYLPGTPGGYGSAPVLMNNSQPMSGGYGAPSYGGTAYGASGAGGYATPNFANPTYGSPATGAAPAYTPTTPATVHTRGGNDTLRDYVPPPLPQSRLENAPLGRVIELRPSADMEKVYGPYVSYDASVETPEGASRRAKSSAMSGLHSVVYQQNAGTPSTLPDGTPIVPYAATAQAAHKRTPSAAARARAAAIHANQATAPEAMTGISRPPADNYAVQLDSAQYSPGYAGPQSGAQVAQPQPTGTRKSQLQPMSTADASQGYVAGSQQTVSQTTVYPQAQPTNSQQGTLAPSQTGDSIGQQYPQPNGRTTTPSTLTRTRVRSSRRTVTAKQSAVDTAPTGPAISYPSVASPLSNPGLPTVAGPYPLGTPPSDEILSQHNIPTLRTYFDPRIDTRAPLTDRQDSLLELGTLEASVSPWLGASVIGRYRSGTPGVDRLSSLEVPFEASAVLADSVRLTVIPKAVFLNSGTLTNTGTVGSNPFLGTLPAGAIIAPQQQFANGVGGELQLATGTFQAAVGYTPYEFLVSNVIGRVRWRPGNRHFTFYGGRDAVTETQLSYAGLRDPGSVTNVFSGNVWGGVVQTGEAYASIPVTRSPAFTYKAKEPT